MEGAALDPEAPVDPEVVVGEHVDALLKDRIGDQRGGE
jgi:hypothetical protein